MKVLIAVDDSEYADDIMDFVLSHEWPPTCEFTVFHAIAPLPLGNLSVVLPPALLEDISDQNWKEGQMVARRAALRLRDATRSQHIHEEVAQGDPKHEILQFSKTWEPNVIVIGSHGRSGFKRAMLGSVSLAVLTHADAAVIVVRPPMRAETVPLEKVVPQATRIRQIVF